MGGGGGHAGICTGLKGNTQEKIGGGGVMQVYVLVWKGILKRKLGGGHAGICTGLKGNTQEKIGGGHAGICTGLKGNTQEKIGGGVMQVYVLV